MHDHDDPKRCTICKRMATAVESYGDILNFKSGGSINATVIDYLDTLDVAQVTQAGVTA